MVSAELAAAIIGMIGVVIGTFVGFVLELIRDWIREKKTKEVYFKRLLKVLEYNLKRAEENRRSGYHDLSLEAKYLVKIPSEQLWSQLYGIQSIISDINSGREYGQITTLIRLLDSAIQQLRELINCKNV